MTVILATVFVSNSNSASHAQSAKVASNSGVNTVVKKPKSAAQVEMENYFQSLKAPIALPDIPDMGSHAKFRFGLERMDKSGRTMIGLRYGTNTPPAQLLDFYKQSLLASKWNLKVSSNTNLQAEKAGKSLIINIMPKGSSDVATDYMLNYSYMSR